MHLFITFYIKKAFSCINIRFQYFFALLMSGFLTLGALSESVSSAPRKDRIECSLLYVYTVLFGEVRGVACAVRGGSGAPDGPTPAIAVIKAGGSDGINSAFLLNPRFLDGSSA